VEESTYGTMPTNPAMAFLAQTAKWSPQLDMSVKPFGRLGSEDFFKLLLGKEVYKSTIEFGIANSTFIKYIILAIAGAGTANKSLSLGMSVKINNTTNYIKLLGSRIASLSLNGNPDNPDIRCVAELEHSDIVTPSTTDYIGTGSHANADSTAPWVFSDGGADPITWNGALDVYDINVRITRALSSKWVMGNKKIKHQYPVNRRITGDITTPWLSTAQEADLKAGTARTLAWVLKSATSTLTLSNVNLTQLSDRGLDVEADDHAIEKFAFTALSITVT
jgi:hypothetical protein